MDNTSGSGATGRGSAAAAGFAESSAFTVAGEAAHFAAVISGEQAAHSASMDSFSDAASGRSCSNASTSSSGASYLAAMCRALVGLHSMSARPKPLPKAPLRATPGIEPDMRLGPLGTVLGMCSRVRRQSGTPAARSVERMGRMTQRACRCITAWCNTETEMSAGLDSRHRITCAARAASLSCRRIWQPSSRRASEVMKPINVIGASTCSS
mmetsp:Transcript_28343/g.64198  ORF Transcript_28343/g.64198 Transcript_28343/m.64198 type:complete len:211 (-) Transcript_28343:500-1132(-)